MGSASEEMSERNLRVTPHIYGGKDDRRAFKDTTWPWRAVGRVITANRGSCTGTLVGKRLILTAQHCLPVQSDGTLGYMKFITAYFDGEEPYGYAYAEHVYYDKKNPPPRNGQLDISEIAWDYVVVKLDRDIGETVGYWGFKVYKPEWNGHGYWKHARQMGR